MKPHRAVTAIALAIFTFIPAPIYAAEASSLVIPSAWEYKDINVSDKGTLETTLNPLGREGWEVVAVIHVPGTGGGEGRIRIILKRANKK